MTGAVGASKWERIVGMLMEKQCHKSFDSRRLYVADGYAFEKEMQRGDQLCGKELKQVQDDKLEQAPQNGASCLSIKSVILLVEIASPSNDFISS